MATYVIATIKSWNIERAQKLGEHFPEHRFYVVTDKNELKREWLDQIQPDMIFFPHWSWIIPAAIYDTFPCVVFHMTDLPFGRGGSPLQNLLARGIYHTQISALRVQKELDAGDIYMKIPLDLSQGNADEIFTRASEIVFSQMIPMLIERPCMPVPQQGEAVVFARRTPEQSELPPGMSMRQIYDHIRMLDGEGYPPAYMQTGTGKIIFTDAQLRDGRLTARAEWVMEK